MTILGERPLQVLLFCSALLTLTPGAQPQAGATEPPEGLAPGSWTGIREAYEAGRHAAYPTEAGYQARNPGQRWRTAFDGRGFLVEPDAGGWSWGLELGRYGFAGDEHTVTEPKSVLAEGHRVVYAWDEEFEEWYQNDARGLEHGYTVHRRPTRGAEQETGTLTFTIRIRGELQPEVIDGGRSVRFLAKDGTGRLTYSVLTVFDADGRNLPARFDRVTAGLKLSIEEEGARYPLTIDPIAQPAYLKASNTEVSDLFGYSVSISGDTVVVGAHGEDSNATGVNGDQSNNQAHGSGAAYVFVRNGDTWIQQAYLKASNTDASDGFGAKVAISGDTVVIGAASEASGATGVNGNQNGNGTPYAGAAYVFQRNGTSWSQETYLKASNSDTDDRFVPVAVCGETLVVGAYREGSASTGVNGDQNDNSAWQAGAAYVFDLDAPTGFPFCFGDPGSGTPCPCNNDNDGSVQGSGCANGVFSSGALLTSSGWPSASNDTLVLAATHLEPNNSGLYFQADNDLSPGMPWGDGLRCAGGSLKRLQVRFADGQGASQTTIGISVKAGNVAAGDTKYYQCWYRTTTNPPCGTGVNDFNATNGYAVTWGP